MKICCLCCYRNAASCLSEFVDHLEPWIDKFLFLDDRSDPVNRERAISVVYKTQKTDGVIMRASRLGDPFKHEAENRTILLREALVENTDWVLCLDADERLELNFLKDLRRICEGSTVNAYTLRVRDLWNSGSQYRVDGVWATKIKPALFDMHATGALLPSEGLHGVWIRNVEPVAELGYNLYHLGSLTPELRAARVAKHEAADPERRYQPDYSYLADETGVQLETIPEGMGYK